MSSVGIQSAAAQHSRSVLVCNSGYAEDGPKKSHASLMIIDIHLCFHARMSWKVYIWLAPQPGQ